jgi:hypothetical protein
MAADKMIRFELADNKFVYLNPVQIVSMTPLRINKRVEATKIVTRAGWWTTYWFVHGSVEENVKRVNDDEDVS